MFGGPALVYYSQNGILTINKSNFQDNKSFKGSLSFEFSGLNLTIDSSNFSFLSTTDLDFEFTSVFLVVGELVYLQTTNCVFENNTSNYGFFVLEDKNNRQTSIYFENITMFRNFAGTTTGIYLFSNKDIIWKNSLIFSHLNISVESLIVSVYLPMNYQHLSIFLSNLNISNNLFVWNLQQGSFITLWAYYEQVMLTVENCILKTHKHYLKI